MVVEKVKNVLKKQHYGLVGEHSAIQVCRWTKKSLLDEGCCYKEQFYGIKSHLCCQMSPSAFVCQNKCLHCWRPIEICENIKIKEIDEPKKIIEDCIAQQKKLLIGFKGNKKINLKKFKEAQNPNQFAISLIGEPTLYPKIEELILELRKQGKTSFLVTNGLNPDKLLEMQEKNALPTQLYLSLNSPNKEEYEKWHNSSLKNSWEVFNKTLRLFPKLKTRKVIRMTLVKDLNMDEKFLEDYAKLILIANPNFIEVKGYMSVGFARQRLGYEKMPFHKDINEFSKKLLKFLPEFKFLDEKVESRVVLLGKDKKDMKII